MHCIFPAGHLAVLEGHWQSPGLGIGVGFWDQIDDVDLLVAFAEAKVCHPSNIALEGKTDQFISMRSRSKKLLGLFFWYILRSFSRVLLSQYTGRP